MQDKIHGKYDVLGRRIKAARMAAGLTQLQLAEKINAIRRVSLEHGK
jgi:transcriptional regulator with XRE-family HTH domain